MIQTVGVNPFAEAMLYYSGRANSEKIENKLAELISQYPDSKEALEKAAKPALTLKKLLDSELDVNEELVYKFFKKIGNRRPTLYFGFCLAYVLIGWVVNIYIDYSPDELCRYIRECSEEDRMYFIRFALDESGEDAERKKYGFDDISKRIESLQIPFEGKWNLINTAINYREETEDLLSIIMPAAKLIEAAKAEYEAVNEEFAERYSDKNAEALLNSLWGVNIAPIKIMKLAPMLFGFYSKQVSIEYSQPTDDNADNTSESNFAYGGMFIGTAKHLMSQTEDSKINKLSKRMQVLSDATRLKLLFYLCKTKAYGQELCAKFDLVPSALSYHISKLHGAGFVAANLSDGKTYYTADKAGIRRVLDEFAEQIK